MKKIKLILLLVGLVVSTRSFAKADGDLPSAVYLTSWQSTATLNVSEAPATLIVSSTTVSSGTAITASLPAVAGQFHYITALEVVAYSTGTNGGWEVPVLVTTTNLPNTPSLVFPTARSIGQVYTVSYVFNEPVKSSAGNTVTTIVCPATGGIIWNVKVFYRAGP